MVEDAPDETHDFKDDAPMSNDGEYKITYNDNVSMKNTSQETIIYEPTEFTRELSRRSDRIKRQRSDSTESTHDVGSEDFNGSDTFGAEDTNNVYSIA